ncbi:unnamed protein product [Rodentolepis nana]|uniref:Uncharacterized protein n=1 Tax=Rodentolepis nana TaxID=102285 RepID=A0A0R3TY43_RODNA|nr:unnamed protein product [Rodentolepis nana]
MCKKTISSGKTNTIECFGLNNLRNRKESGTPFATLLIRLEERKTSSDQTGRTEDVQAWRRQSAVPTQATLRAKRTSFDNFISNINYQCDTQRILNSWVTSKTTQKDARKTNTLQQQTAYHRLRNS